MKKLKLINRFYKNLSININLKKLQQIRKNLKIKYWNSQRKISDKLKLIVKVNILNLSIKNLNKNKKHKKYKH